jgi:anion-transporting  ArsA/GET3 family ATPase
MLVEIESYEEFKERELKFHSAISKNTYIKEYKDGRELLYSGGTCQITDLRKSYEKYCKSMEDMMERVKKFKEEYVKEEIPTCIKLASVRIF